MQFHLVPCCTDARVPVGSTAHQQLFLRRNLAIQLATGLAFGSSMLVPRSTQAQIVGRWGLLDGSISVSELSGNQCRLIEVALAELDMRIQRFSTLSDATLIVEEEAQLRAIVQRAKTAFAKASTARDIADWDAMLAELSLIIAALVFVLGAVVAGSAAIAASTASLAATGIAAGATVATFVIQGFVKGGTNPELLLAAYGANRMSLIGDILPKTSSLRIAGKLATLFSAAIEIYSFVNARVIARTIQQAWKVRAQELNDAVAAMEYLTTDADAYLQARLEALEVSRKILIDFLESRRASGCKVDLLIPISQGLSFRQG